MLYDFSRVRELSHTRTLYPTPVKSDEIKGYRHYPHWATTLSPRRSQRMNDRSFLPKQTPPRRVRTMAQPPHESPCTIKNSRSFRGVIWNDGGTSLCWSVRTRTLIADSAPVKTSTVRIGIWQRRLGIVSQTPSPRLNV
jgi:hypothetical protein